MKKSLPVSTGSTIHGFKIEESLGFVSSHVIAATNIFSDLFASFSDIFGGRSETYKKQLTAIKKEAIQELMDEAIAIGGDGIVAMSIDLDEVSGGGKSMFMITATGTAVRIDQSQRPVVSQDRNIKELSESKLNELIVKERIIVAAKLLKLEFNETNMKDIIQYNIFEVRDYISSLIARCVKSGYWGNDSRLENEKKQCYTYFSNMPPALAIDSLYAYLGKDDFVSIAFLHIIKECKLFDYEKVIELLQSDQLECKRLAIQIIHYPKSSYKREDIGMLNQLAEAVKLNITPISKVYRVKKIMGSKMVWKCECSRENEADTELCQCGLNKLGFQQKEIGEVFTLIRERIKALETAFAD